MAAEAEREPGSDPDPHTDVSPAPGGSGGVEVVGFDRTADGFPELDRLVELARATLEAEGVGIGRLDLVMVDPDEMAELNVEHMGHEGPTDVLSFPLDADEVLAGTAGPGAAGSAGARGPDGAIAGPPPHLGDVIVCPVVARRQAPGHCGSEEAELALLVIHGVLHVLGHDHAEPEEAARMRARERANLAPLGHPHPEIDGVRGR